MRTGKNKEMKKRLSLHFMLIMGIAIGITMLLMGVIFWVLITQSDYGVTISGQVFLEALPSILFAFVVSGVMCVLLGKWMLKKLMAPIEELAQNLDNLDKVKTYREFDPVVDTLKQQHLAIIENTNMRSEFTANVSHELKTPLTAILGYAELIESEMATQSDTLRFAGEIRRNSNRLLVLIDDILRLSQLDSTQIEISVEQVDLYQVAQNCVNLLEMNAKSRQITLELQGKPAHLKANKVMLEELVYNLCDNAIRYNNDGGRVDILVGSEKGVVTLSVADTGIGIPAEHQDRIFERFYRVDKSRSKARGGTGLGLAIVKHIAVQHGAVIQVESEVNKGTVIRVTFE